MTTEYQNYLNEKKILYEQVLQFIDSTDNTDENFQKLIIILKKQKIDENQSELKNLLRLLVSISNNHFNQLHIYNNNLFQFLEYLSAQIKKIFTNKEIFKIFKDSKSILLYLIENQIFIIDEHITELILQLNGKKSFHYRFYFYPEIKQFLRKEDKNVINQEITPDFYKKRKIGQNSSTICELIREDSIIEFIKYINKNDISLSSQIKPSIFERSPLLLQNDPTLIEYAAFCGSIQIFNYLRTNKVELKPSLWIYGIHSNNEEIIYLIEESKIEPPESSFINCLTESIKCHHNGITEYIKNALMGDEQEYITDETFCKSIFQSCNYKEIPEDLNNNYLFFFASWYEFSELVNLYLKPKIDDVKNKITDKTEFYDLIRNEALQDNKNIEMIYILLTLSGFESTQDIFKKCANLEYLVIPPSITKIGKNSFYECTDLKQVLIPSTVTIIEKNGFAYTYSLKKIVLTPFLKYIGEGCFSRCNELKQIVFPSSLAYIETYTVFHKNGSLESIFFEKPSQLDYICTYFCQHLYSLKKITLPSSITEICSDSFYYCENLKQITIPSSVKVMDNACFKNCKSLENVFFEKPYSLKTIGYQAFFNSKIKSIIIPSSVTLIRQYAFRKCRSLKKVDFDSPSSLVEIGEEAFYMCSSLTNISIPDSVTTIRNYAFQYCLSLEKVTVPSALNTKNLGITVAAKIEKI